uniref:Flavodoxin-like fold domain-containing protein n=1 Tax=Knipowitschia caucasica TaxID=637954 RepID=A0AAV2K196_KNICA
MRERRRERGHRYLPVPGFRTPTQTVNQTSAAGKDAAAAVLKSEGITVEVSDLYAVKFKATATAEDITGEVNNFLYAEETKAGQLCADISEEQCKVEEADLIIFQFPMYWFSVAAILKGWFDRVLTLGFAYTQEKHYSRGIFVSRVLPYCGLRILAPQIFWAPASASPDSLQCSSAGSVCTHIPSNVLL